MDLKNASGNYEFTVTPRALFVTDGSILPCTDKSKLIHCLTNLEKPSESDPNEQVPSSEVHAGNADKSETSPAPSESLKIAIVDGVVIVQQMAKKSGTISTVNDFCQHFNDRLLTLTVDFDKVILDFDTYKADSLKQKTREKRWQGTDPIQYRIADDTCIKHIPMGCFLSHEKNESRSN